MSKAHISLLEALVSVLLVLAIVVVIAKCYQSLSYQSASTLPGSSIGTTEPGITIIPKRDNF